MTKVLNYYLRKPWTASQEPGAVINLHKTTMQWSIHKGKETTGQSPDHPFTADQCYPLYSFVNGFKENHYYQLNES